MIDLNLLKKYKADGYLRSQRHPYFDITIWNYTDKTQYERKWDEITLLCRGLVVDNKTGDILGLPFKKFFNIEETDFTPSFKENDKFECFEKMDGSLILMFFYCDTWVFASRGSFTSDHAIAAKNIMEYIGYNKFNNKCTYLFELIAPWNRIIVDYGNIEKLVLLGANYNNSFDNIYNYNEIPYNELKASFNDVNGLEIVKRYENVKSIKGLKEIIGDNQEGFVIKFENGERLKIKSINYFKLNKIISKLNNQNIWQCMKDNISMLEFINDNEIPDEYYKWIYTIENDIRLNFNKIKNYYMSLYENNYKDIINQKEFALAIKNIENNDILFNIKKNANFDGKIWKLVKPTIIKSIF